MTPFPVIASSPQTRDQAAQTLGRAFVNDPMFVTTLTDPVRRVAALPLIFRAMAAQTGRYGLIDLEDHGTGAALWVDGAHADISVPEVVRFGFVRAGVAGGIADMLRLQRVQAAITAVHHEVMGDRPHGYLFALGVDPTAQGRGLGSALLRTGCLRLDRAGLPGYLETNLPQNVRLYERFGFRTRRHLHHHGFETWFMERPVQDRPAEG